MMRTAFLVAVCCAGVCGRCASASVVGGGFVSLESWNSAASAAIGTEVTVYRMYLAFDETGVAGDNHVNLVFSSVVRADAPLFQESVFGGDFIPNESHFALAPTLEWDSFVTLNALSTADGASMTPTPSFGFGADGVQGGWFIAGSTQGRAQPDSQFGSGLDLVLIAQLTVIGAHVVGDLIDIRSDGAVGTGGMFSGYLSIGLNNVENPSVALPAFGKPVTPSAMLPPGGSSPPTEPTYSDFPPLSGRNLVIITHGCCQTRDNIDNVWATYPTAVSLHIDVMTPHDVRDWDVRLHDWYSLQARERFGEFEAPNPHWDAMAAIASGVSLGAKIASLDVPPEHVHLIGHGAGATLMSIAASVLRRQAPDVTIHTTFLDAPILWSGDLERLGRDADWADHYVVEERTASTNALFAPNVFTENLTCDAVSADDHTHGYAHRAYFERSGWTLVSDGFARSFEGGNMLDALTWNTGALPAVGNTALSWRDTCWDPGPVVRSGAREAPALVEHFDGAINFADHSVDSRGAEFNENGFTLQTGAEASWLTVAYETNRSINRVRFDVQVEGSPESSALLTIYVDGEDSGFVDGRLQGASSESITAPLPELPPGTHALSFRLDEFTDGAASIEVVNVQTGLSLFEPSPATLLSPSPESVTETVTPTLEWLAGPDASRYTVEVDIEPTFGAPLFLKTTDSLSATLPKGAIFGRDTYYWRITSWNSVGAAESAVFTFSTPLLGDYDLDGSVGSEDLAFLLSRWGVVDEEADLNGDASENAPTGGVDLAVLLSNWGPR